MPKESQSVDRIAEIARKVAEQIPGLFEQARDQITEAINAATEEKQEAESEAPVSVSMPIAIKWVLDANAVDVKLSVSCKRTFSEIIVLDDPNQTKLPLEGGAK